MAIQIQGDSGVVAEVDGPTFRTQRTAAYPLEYGAYGHYRMVTTVALTAGQVANGTLFSFRWGDATRLAVIQLIRLGSLQTQGATATIMPMFQVVVARGFTASDSGGTAIVTTGNNMKKRTSMGTSLVTDIRKSTVAAGLTVGTRTLDAESMIDMNTQQTITTPNPTLYEREVDFHVGNGDHPLVLAQNEGFIVRGPSIVFAASGTMNLSVGVVWAEVDSF